MLLLWHLFCVAKWPAGAYDLTLAPHISECFRKQTYRVMSKCKFLTRHPKPTVINISLLISWGLPLVRLQMRLPI